MAIKFVTDLAVAPRLSLPRGQRGFTSGCILLFRSGMKLFSRGHLRSGGLEIWRSGGLGSRLGERRDDDGFSAAFGWAGCCDEILVSRSKCCCWN
jgi:hypothetical protein